MKKTAKFLVQKKPMNVAVLVKI